MRLIRRLDVCWHGDDVVDTVRHLFWDANGGQVFVRLTTDYMDEFAVVLFVADEQLVLPR